MSIQDQRRERFEQAYHDKFGRLPQSWHDALGKYLDAHAQGAWWAWNAALDSVVIELPPCIDADEVAEHFAIDEQGHDMAVGISQMVNGAIIACGAFIKAAGLKVSP